MIAQEIALPLPQPYPTTLAKYILYGRSNYTKLQIEHIKVYDLTINPPRI